MVAPAESGTFTRRVALGKTAVLATPLLAACGQDAYSAAQPKVSGTAKTGARDTSARPPTSPVKDGAQANNKETLNSLDRGAKQKAFDFFLQKLSSPDRFELPPPVNYFKTITAAFTTPLPEATKTQIIDGTPVSSDMMTVAWTYTSSQIGTTVGEARLQKHKLTATPQTLGDADKANGITWKGTVAVGFLEQHRAVNVLQENPPGFPPGQYLVTNPDDLKKIRYTLPYTNFSEWKDGQFAVLVTQKNNQWSTQAKFIPDKDVTFPLASYDLSQEKCQPQEGCIRIAANQIPTSSNQPTK